jgi:hypothetical protein
MPALHLAKQALESAIWSWWLWVLLWALAAGLTVWGTGDYRYPLTVGIWRLFRLAAWSWLVAFVVFGGMSIGPRFHAGVLHDAPLWAETFRWAGRIFAIAPVMWGGLTVFAWSQTRDPWLKFPGGPAFRLQAFAGRHPGLAFEEYENNTVGVWHNGEQVFFDYAELSNATLHFEPCGDRRSGAALRGLPVFPDSECLFRVLRESPAEIEVRHMFRAPGVELPNVIEFYKAQLESRGAELVCRYDRIFAKTKTDRWRIEVRPRGKASPTHVYISYFLAPRGGDAVRDAGP